MLNYWPITELIYKVYLRQTAGVGTLRPIAAKGRKTEFMQRIFQDEAFG